VGTLFNWVHKIKVNVVENQWHSESHSDFCESLTQANAFTTKEWSERQRIAWLSFACLSPLV
jgi:hypothetical protein